jgi:hypothetical protein
MASLAAWQNFSVIIGSSAGALIGLQFVVMTLMVELPLAQGEAESIGTAYATPTIIHFSSALFVAAVLSAPWGDSVLPVLLWRLNGAFGMAYCLLAARKQGQQTVYEPVAEDWLFFVILPFAAYTLLFAVSFCAAQHADGALLGVGAALLALLFIGIRNAWDSVTYGIYVAQERLKQKLVEAANGDKKAGRKSARRKRKG